ncbi:MAG TPA: hypothetical protein VK766_01545 [Cytophagaceae bacterium]|jgi:hypothetical protein|nr:hypothetical protein [Cytophagaceae bacterium]
MLKILLTITSLFLLTSFVYGQNDSLRTSEEDSIIYIEKAPLIIKKTIEIVQSSSEKKWQLFLIGYTTGSFFKDSYITTSTGDQTYTNTIKTSLKGDFSFRWGGELIFIRNRKNSIGLQYDFGKMNQKFNYSFSNQTINCDSYINHYYILFKLGKVIPISKKISFHPKLGIGTAILYQQGGLIPTLSSSSYYDALYSSYIKTKEFTPMIELETSFLYRLSDYFSLGVSPYINGNIFTYTIANSPFNIYRKNYGARLLLSFRLI